MIITAKWKGRRQDNEKNVHHAGTLWVYGDTEGTRVVNVPFAVPGYACYTRNRSSGASGVLGPCLCG